MGFMKKANFTAVHIVDGQPWKDALISILEPRSPYRPWHTASGIQLGDAAIAVLDTDPESVLAGIAIVGPDGDVRNAMAAIDRFHLNGLLELGTLNMLADFVVHPQSQTVYHRDSLDAVVALIGDYHPSTADALFGHTSLGAGRVLLESGGKRAGCGRQLDLTQEDARDRVHIHTVHRPGKPQRSLPRKARSGGRKPRGTDTDYSDFPIEIGPRYPRSLPADWPAVLCDSCHDTMHTDGFTSFLDFLFSRHPRCPSCSAQRALSTMYGMRAGRVEEPWIATMGRCVQPWEWVCAECGHEW